MKKKMPMNGTFEWLHGKYHWIVAGVLVLMIFVHGGSINNFSSLHLIPMTEHLSITRADFALAYSIKSLVGMLSTFFSGFFISRWGSRVTAPLGLCLLGISYLILANVTDWFTLALGCGLMGASYGFCTTSGAVAVVRLWFHRYEGTVLGLVTAASGLGGSLLCILQTAAMETSGFQASLKLCAVLAFVMVVLIILILRNRPEDMGLLPLGDGERGKKRPTSVGFAGLSIKELWKQPSFYLLLFSVFLAAFSLYLSFNVTRNFFLDCGFTAGQASGLYSVMMLLLTLTKFLTGACCDRIGAKRTNLICLVCATVGLLLLAATRSFSMSVVAVVVYSIALPVLTIMGPLIAVEVFGYRAQLQYTGMLVSAVSMANLFGNYVTNLIYDTFHSYRPSFVLAAVLAAVSIVLFFLVYRVTGKLRESTEA